METRSNYLWKYSLLGDTHGDFRRFRPDIFYEQEHMTKEDLVLVCGDYTE